MTKGSNSVGMAGVAVGVVLLVLSLFGLATGHLVGGGIAALLAAAAIGAGLAWLIRVHRKVRNAELEWHALHSDEPAPPPSS
ncbi:hypothetical protein MB901379_03125 [Mycobacterium basiliense]|uniref:UsfY protein n=2 Tax=Mycobacterium basiliense TaxID=2094119 RepID=A0A447GGK2_9MYCO|nr:hypothetical protein MB901379_03125 [Mycobacterium basiliense]